jgi:hypothetical protein
MTERELDRLADEIRHERGSAMRGQVRTRSGRR